MSWAMVGKLLTAKLSTCIQQIPADRPYATAAGKFCLVGSMPAECCDLKPPDAFHPKGRYASKHWDTLAEACAAVEAAGVTEYQLPDCSWVGRD